MSDLLDRSCRPIPAGAPPLSPQDVRRLLAQIPSWTLTDDDRAIVREYAFSDFHETMAFVNALAWIAHREDHHPDLEVGYRRCRVRFSTHSVGGLSDNDFICAAKIDSLSA